MSINPIKNKNGDETVTLRIASLPEVRETKGQQVIKLKLDQGESVGQSSQPKEQEMIYALMKLSQFTNTNSTGEGSISDLL